MAHVARWLWNRSPVMYIGAFLLVQVGLFRFIPGGDVFTAALSAVAFVVVMAYLQNWSYTLSSRSAMRNSNAYHLLAAAFGSATFYVTFRYLALHNMPGVLFPAYLFATVLGSVHGAVISTYIEKRLNLDVIATRAERALGIEKVKKEKGDPDDQFFRFWPSVIVLLLAFVGEVAWLRQLDVATMLAVTAACLFIGQVLRAVINVVQGQPTDADRLAAWLTARLRGRAILAACAAHALYLLPYATLLGLSGWQLRADQPKTFMLVAVLLLSIPDNFLHAVLRVARSTDHYWFHLFAVLAKLAAGFLQLLILFKLDFNWALFIPMMTGGMLGSLTGSTFAAEFAQRISAGFDAHIINVKKVAWPKIQMAVLVGAGLVVQLAVYRLYQWRGVLTLLGLAFLQMMSFTLISRARNRKDKQYHAWASVCSNASWYLTMDVLSESKIMPFQAAPYVVGNATGSLIGQGVALKLEQVTGAVMVDKSAKPAAESAPKAATA